MILTDISESSLSSARREMESRGLLDRVIFRLGDGLSVLEERCDMISVLGMGGRNIQEILLRGEARLQGAVLLLSAHSNLPLVRRAVSEIGYRLISETPCLDDGRFYLMLHAEPGRESLSSLEIRTGTRLFESDSPLLSSYLRHMREIQESRLRGLMKSSRPDEPEIQMTREIITHYKKEELKHDSH